MAQTIAGGALARRPIPHHHRRSAWPFLVQPAHTSVSDQGVGVPARQEVEFDDGRRVWLLRVEKQQGVPELFLRDVGIPATGCRIDLRELVPEIAGDLPRASTRDVPGIVHFSLRSRFKSLEQFLQAAVASRRPE